jgi:hypothetical protein
MSTIGIVILNWNNPSDTVNCLRSLAQAVLPDVEMIVVDNGSTDDSAAIIQYEYPACTLLQTGVNLGYAGGNNVGIRHALATGAEFVMILNNDVIVSPDFLAPLIATFHALPEAGIVTPLIADTEPADRIWALGSRVDWRTGQVYRLHAGESVETQRAASPFEVEIASGAAMLIRRRALEEVGLLDEQFFLYYEETDWCLTVRRAGYRIVAVPQSVVWHKVSATLGTVSPVIDYYMQRNQLRFIARQQHGWRRASLLLRTLVRNLMTIAAYTVKSQHGRRRPHRNARLYALRDALRRQWGPMSARVRAACQTK